MINCIRRKYKNCWSTWYLMDVKLKKWNIRDRIYQHWIEYIKNQFKALCKKKPWRQNKLVDASDINNRTSLIFYLLLLAQSKDYLLHAALTDESFYVRVPNFRMNGDYFFQVPMKCFYVPTVSRVLMMGAVREISRVTAWNDFTWLNLSFFSERE